MLCILIVNFLLYYREIEFSKAEEIRPNLPTLLAPNFELTRTRRHSHTNRTLLWKWKKLQFCFNSKLCINMSWNDTHILFRGFWQKLRTNFFFHFYSIKQWIFREEGFYANNKSAWNLWSPYFVIEPIILRFLYTNYF